MTREKTVILLLFALLLGACALAQAQERPLPIQPAFFQGNDANSDVNALPTDALSAKNSLDELTAAIGKMRDAELNTRRVRDTAIIAREQYRTDLERYKSSKITDFSGTRERVRDAMNVVDLAFNASAEVYALQTRLDEVRGEIDANAVDQILGRAKTELQDERYEKAIELTNVGQEKIIELQSFETKTRAAAEAATANIASFLDRNKIIIISGLAVLLVLYLIIRRHLKHYLLVSNIRALEIERDVLKKEIQKAQEAFFVKTSLSEGLYHVQIDVFSTLIREITRKIAVLTEEERKSRLFDVGIFGRLTQKKAPAKPKENTDLSRNKP